MENMNWVDEGALYSQISVFLREDLGRGDITSQAIIERNTRARGRFLAARPVQQRVKRRNFNECRSHCASPL